MSQREEAWLSSPTLASYVDHLQSFNRVESFTLSHFSFEIFGLYPLRPLLCSLIPSVRRLRLHHVTTHPHSILRFISNFTNLQDTMIHKPYWIASPHQDDLPPATLTLGGELRLSGLEEDSCQFLELLGSQVTRYEKVILRNCRLLNFYPLQRLILGVRETIRQLDIVAVDDGKFTAPSSKRTLSKICSSIFRSQ